MVDVPDAEVGDEADLVPEACLDDGIVKASQEAQARKGRPGIVHGAIGENQHHAFAGASQAGLDRGGERPLETRGAFAGNEGGVEGGDVFLAPEPAQLPGRE